MDKKQDYQSPALVVIGSVSELTEVNKVPGNADGGITFEGQPTSIEGGG